VHHSHNFTGGGTNHREAKDAIVAVAKQSFHKAFPLIGRLGPEHGVHRQLYDANDDTLAFRFAFAQPDAGEWRISEHAIWNQAVVRAAISACEIVAYDSSCHIDGDGTSNRAIAPAVTRQVRDFRARDLILAWHTGDVWT
jgi:hypothetical protein